MYSLQQEFSLVCDHSRIRLYMPATVTTAPQVSQADRQILRTFLASQVVAKATRQKGIWSGERRNTTSVKIKPYCNSSSTSSLLLNCPSRRSWPPSTLNHCRQRTKRRCSSSGTSASSTHANYTSSAWRATRSTPWPPSHENYISELYVSLFNQRHWLLKHSTHHRAPHRSRR